MDSVTAPLAVLSSLECSPVTNLVFIDQGTLQTPSCRRPDHATSVNTPPMDHDIDISSKMHSIRGLSTPPTSSPPPTCNSALPHRKRTLEAQVLQTHINFPIFLPIFPDFLERLSHLAPIY
jgi:hypothetical protein